MHIIFTYNFLKGSNGYKFGFNGQVKDDEIYGEGNTYSAQYWEYDARLGRRWNLDPVDQISISNYACFWDNPIWNIDPNGDWVKGAGFWRNLFNSDEKIKAENTAASIPGSLIKKDNDGWTVTYSKKTDKSLVEKYNLSTETTVVEHFNKNAGRYWKEKLEDWKQNRDWMNMWEQAGVEMEMVPVSQAREDMIRLWGMVLFPNVISKATQATNTGVNLVDNITIQFGKEQNQVSHAFHHTDALGLERSLVQLTIETHFKTVSSQVVAGKPFNQIVEIAVQRIQYTAFKLQNGTYNIGRIHGVN